MSPRQQHVKHYIYGVGLKMVFCVNFAGITVFHKLNNIKYIFIDALTMMFEWG